MNGKRSLFSTCKKRLAGILSKGILAVAVCIIGILAIPVCILLLPIILVWSVADRLLGALEEFC